jgi:lysine biosynthesis protein LysW
MNTNCPDCNAHIRLKNQPRIGQIISCNDCQSSARLISTVPAVLESLDAVWGEDQSATAQSHRPARNSKKRQGFDHEWSDLDLDDGIKPRREDHDRSKKKRSKRRQIEDFPLA